MALCTGSRIPAGHRPAWDAALLPPGVCLFLVGMWLLLRSLREQ